MTDLKGKKALITGASSGFGADFADILAKKGMDLVITARREDKLNALKAKIVEKYGVSVRVIVMDLSGFEAACGLYEKVRDENIDMLINNAGYGMYEYFERHIVWYAWIVMVSQWPTLNYFRDAMQGKLKTEILSLLSLIATLPEEQLSVI